jgi:hypothetical protein
MSASVPFRLWIEAGCPDTYDYDGMHVTADDIIGYEYDAIGAAGAAMLEDDECEKLGIPVGSSNEMAIQHIRQTRPLKLPRRPW